MTDTAFDIETVSTVPSSLRGGTAGSDPNTAAYEKAMREMPAPTPAKGKNPPQFSSFFVPAPVADTITGDRERDKAARANCKKLANTLNNVAKRIKAGDGGDAFDYTFRTARKTANDPFSPWGVRVFRVPQGFDKGGPKRAA